jgi:hypothetical protein
MGSQLSFPMNSPMWFVRGLVSDPGDRLNVGAGSFILSPAA